MPVSWRSSAVERRTIFLAVEDLRPVRPERRLFDFCDFRGICDFLDFLTGIMMFVMCEFISYINKIKFDL